MKVVFEQGDVSAVQDGRGGDLIFWCSAEVFQALKAKFGAGYYLQPSLVRDGAYCANSTGAKEPKRSEIQDFIRSLLPSEKPTPPQPKHAIGIAHDLPNIRIVQFHAPAEIAAMLTRFGMVEEYKLGKDHYGLHVDSRYDYAEVLAFMRAYPLPKA